jgi:hypothetical protein
MEPTSIEILSLYGFKYDESAQGEGGDIYIKDDFEVSHIDNYFMYEGGINGRHDVSTVDKLLSTWLKVKGIELTMQL